MEINIPSGQDPRGEKGLAKEGSRAGVERKPMGRTDAPKIE
jgi:hypothetical protein